LFQILTLEDVVRIPPPDFDKDINEIAIKQLKEKYESTVTRDYGFLIKILSASAEKIGKVLHGDGGKYHRVQFDVLSFYPVLGELIEGKLLKLLILVLLLKSAPRMRFCI